MAQPSESPPGSAAPGAVRLIFSYEGDAVRLVLQQPIDVAVTGFDLDPVPLAGHYVEVRTAEGRALSRVRVHGGIPTSAEVFGAPGEPITRTELEHPQGAFTVVVPAPTAAVRAPAERLSAPSAQVVDLLDVAIQR
jgi:hypothetical protein